MNKLEKHQYLGWPICSDVFPTSVYLFMNKIFCYVTRYYVVRSLIYPTQKRLEALTPKCSYNPWTRNQEPRALGGWFFKRFLWFQIWTSGITLVRCSLYCIWSKGAVDCFFVTGFRQRNYSNLFKRNPCLAGKTVERVSYDSTWFSTSTVMEHFGLSYKMKSNEWFWDVHSFSQFISLNFSYVFCSCYKRTSEVDIVYIENSILSQLSWEGFQYH